MNNDYNSYLQTGSLTLWVLLFGLIFPRLTLFIAWLTHGAYPPNVLPDLVNFISWLCFPRFLMAYYIYTDIGTNNLWFWAYIVVGIVGFFGETGLMRHRLIRRTTVSNNGRTTTTIEEEI